MKKNLAVFLSLAILTTSAPALYASTKNTMMLQYITVFNPQEVARTNNIKLAAKKLNGLIIKPAEVISFNEKVGPRTFEAGFLESTSFLKGKRVNSVGGGICQVASTLAMAAFKMKLEIIERHRHSLPVNYGESNTDATVVYGQKDFKFRNNTPKTLQLKCLVIGNRLIVEFWNYKET